MNQTRKFLQRARSLSLSESEKSFGRLEMSHLFAVQPGPLPFHRWFFWPAMVAAVSAAVVILAGGTVALAAEGTMPGDALYTVKINFTEPVRTALAVTPRVKVEWAAEKLDRRLEEAEVLAYRHSVGQAALAKSVTEQSQQLSQQLKQLRESGQDNLAAQVGDDVAANLAAHFSLLSRLDQEDQNDNATNQDILETVKNNQTELANNPAPAATIPNNAAAATGKERAAKQKIAEVKSWISKAAPRYDADVVSAARAIVAKAEATLTGGETQLSATDYRGAFQSFQTALRQAQDAKIFLSAHQRWQQEKNRLQEQSQARPSRDGQPEAENANAEPGPTSSISPHLPTTDGQPGD